MNYPDKNLIINTLLEVARRAGIETTANHPEDVASAMLNAIEYGAVVIDILHKAGHLEKQRPLLATGGFVVDTGSPVR